MCERMDMTVSWENVTHNNRRRLDGARGLQSANLWVGTSGPLTWWWHAHRQLKESVPATHWMPFLHASTEDGGGGVSWGESGPWSLANVAFFVCFVVSKSVAALGIPGTAW